LADRYTIERELGRGGMATVFLAHDRKHDRRVAVKVLDPELARTVGPDRFLREIRTIAALQHSHILGLIDSGEVSGTTYYVMPFVDGGSLRDRMVRESQLAVAEAIRITSEVAAALDYAHRHGVIHRDIKPENILLTGEGEVLVSDFGIARLIGSADEALTRTGISLGTPAYMSPEQATGDRSVDARSDIYALGTVVYEMLAGEPPFSGPNAQAVIAKRFSTMPTPVRVVRPEIPEQIEAAVERALARSPADRFASAAAFAAALVAGEAGRPAAATVAVTAPSTARTRRTLPVTLLAMVIGFAIGLGVLFAWRRDHGHGTETEVRRIAVLPFENLGDTSEAYFADGVSDAVRSKLTTLAGLAVIARTSSIQYRGGSKAPREIASELGVRYLLTGAVRWAKSPDGKSRVQVSPELIEITDGAPESRWAQPFDAALTDVFQVQADIARKVGEALGVALGAGARKALADRPTQNVAAYDDFLRGEAIYVARGAADPASLLKAESWYASATAKDSAFALAWAQLSSVLTSQYPWDPSPDRARRSREAAERALRLSPDLAEGERSLAEHLDQIVNDAAGALTAARRAHELNPGDADALGLLANLEPSDSGMMHLRQARDLDPRSVVTAIRMSTALLYRRQYDEAWSEAERGLAFAPANPSLVMNKIRVRLAHGDRAGAQEVLQDALLRSGNAAELIRYWDLTWFLTNEQRHALLGLPGEAWPGWQYRSGILALAAFAVGDSGRARAYSDSAIVGISGYLLTDPPRRAFNYWARGLHLANLGRIREARADRDRAATLGTDWTDLQVLMAWLDLLVGDKAGAVAELRQVLDGRHYINRAWLRIDDRFAALRGYPAFDALVAGA
jgi:serine/threonine-protein kinase